MKTFNVKGIVLSSLLYKETSKIVYLYTPNGKYSIKALGSLKQKKGLLPLTTTLNMVDVIINDKDFPTAIDYSLIDSYEEIKTDLKKELWAMLILEMISKLTSDSLHDRIYNLLIKTLDLLKNNDPAKVGIIFMVKMTYGFGIAPVLNRCIKCGSDDVSYFSVLDGGALCNNHKNGYKELDDIKKIYHFDIYNDEINNLDVDFYKAFRIINEYYDTHLDIKFKGITSLII